MITKKIKKVAKKLFKHSLDEKGYINSNKVRDILAKITKEKPQGLTGILKTYKRLIETALKREEIIMEAPVKIDGKLQKELLKKTGARKVSFHTNQQLVFGARITHGDWIWEETLDSKLSQLTTDI